MNNEPVAYLMVDRNDGNSYIQMGVPTKDEKISHQPYPLYTHSAKLIDEEIQELALSEEFWMSEDCTIFDWFNFAKAILRKAQEK